VSLAQTGSHVDCNKLRPARAIGLITVCWTLISGCGEGVGGRHAGATNTTVCGPNDRPEIGLQGQVPAPLRKLGGFAGFSCNLELMAQSRGDGAGWQTAFVTDATGRRCVFYDTSPSKTGRTQTGVVVIDATDPDRPVASSYLTSQTMTDPLESLKVNQQRHLLAAVGSLNEDVGPDIELYDVSTDCRAPRLLSPTAASRGGSKTPRDIVRADEGAFSADGLTYYATNLRAGSIYVIDIEDPSHPKRIAQWDLPFNQRTSGLSISAKGDRAYLTLFGHGLASSFGEAGSLDNGIIIADVSEVQARKPNPQIRVISTLLWGDGSESHQTIPIRIDGRPYLIATDQGGAGTATGAGWRAACAAGLPPWSMARIIDISDETHPRVVAKTELEANDPANCNKVIPDLAGLSGFTYDTHYCSVDDTENATALACAFFEAGIRVFDIRDPHHLREIAYFVPASATTPSPGSQNNRATANGRPDHCSAQIRLDAASASLMTTCQDSGFLALRLTHGVWPFATSATPPGEQN
jgi:hypothetical protein